MRTLKPHGEYRVATQGLDHDADGPVDKSPLFIKVARKANLDTKARQYSQVGLRRRVAEIPRGDVLRTLHSIMLTSLLLMMMLILF